MEEKKELSAGEICVIVKACAKARVETLQFRDLHVTFRASATEIADIQKHTSQNQTVEPEDLKQLEFSATQLSSSDEEEDDLAELMAVVDPVLFERMQVEDDEDGQLRHREA